MVPRNRPFESGCAEGPTMCRSKTLSLRAGWLCSVAAISAAVVFSVTPASAVPPTQQHQSPPGCTSNNLSLDLAKSKTEIVSGEVVTYTVTVGNSAAGGGCDITGLDVTFTCPDANGTPNGTTSACLTDVALPAGTPPFTACQINCTVTV